MGLAARDAGGTPGRQGGGGARISAPATSWRSSGRRAAAELVPFTRAAVPVVDLAAGFVRSCRRPSCRPGRLRVSAPWTATVLTIFPEMFPGPLGASLAGKALERGLLAAGRGRPARLRRRPPPDRRRHAVRRRCRHGDAARHRGPRGGRAWWRTARPARSSISARAASRLRQARVRELAAGPGVVLLCGRYEGVDQRVIEARGFLEVSLGDFVLPAASSPPWP